ncbi:MAG: phosphoglycerate dehydrogenase [Cellvibrionales bacterium]|nr:phosphoglycerate dehydrogenase [Cellvibrionales bacterium]
MYRIRTYNAIAAKGLACFPAERYAVGPAEPRPDACILRSHKLHGEPLPDSLLAIARAGAGVNNVPVDACSERGIVVFNTPGANANAVKELVVTGMGMACRDLAGGIAFCRGLAGTAADAEMPALLEKNKKTFAGSELQGKTLGVVGLGAIGAMVANLGLELGMQVAGYDPAISVEAAWRLSSLVEKMDSLEALLGRADFVTLHVPAIESTYRMINSERLKLCAPGTVLLNFARESIVDNGAVLAALDSGQLRRFVTDFPDTALAGHPAVIPMPHLGASTAEAEENCAIMAAEQIIDYLENGNIRNSVNFPTASMSRMGKTRITFANQNVPRVLGTVLGLLSEANINIADMLNRSRAELAYNIIDVEAEVDAAMVTAIGAVEGVSGVRVL